MDTTTDEIAGFSLVVLGLIMLGGAIVALPLGGPHDRSRSAWGRPSLSRIIIFWGVGAALVFVGARQFAL